MKKVLILLVASVAFVSAACGDSKDGGSAKSSDTAKSSDKTSTTETVAKGDPNSDFCDLARKFTKDFKDTTDAQDAQGQAAVFKDLRVAIDQLEKKAPKEIKDDVNVVAVAFRQSDDLLKKYDYDFTKVPEEEASKISLDDPKTAASSDRVESYFETTCGIDTDGDGDTDGIINSTTTTSPGDSGTNDTTETTAAGD